MRYQRSLLIRLAFLLVILAVAVTACDSGDDTDSETQPTVAATITPPLTKTPIPTFTPFPTFTATQPFIAPPTSTQLVLRPTSAVVVPTSTPLVPSATPYPYDIRITYPVDGSTIAGYVTVIGSASHPRFVQYALEWGPEPNPGNLWYPFLSPPQRTNIVQNGALGSWDTKIVRDGIYRVRLHVWLNDGTDTDYVIGSIRVSNSQPTAVPTFTHTPRPNQPPTIDPIASQKVQTAKVINIPVTTRDADNDTVNLYVTSDNTAVAIAQVVSGSGITVAGVSAGTATITVTANDNHGGTVSTAFIATVEGENHAPTINPIGSQTLKTGESRNITITVSDPDGNTLTVSAVSDNTTIVNASAPNTSTVSLAAGNTPGTANVTVTANDGKGGINNVTFQVAVTAPNLPSINAIADQSMTVGDTLDVAYTVVDGSGTPITNTVTAQVASGNTAIATADIPAAGTIRLNAAGAGTAAITLTASDGTNPAVTAAFNVIVTAPNLPSINAIADQSMTVGDTLDVAYTVVDSIGNVITGSVTTEALSDNDGIAAAVVTAPGTIQLTANGVGQVNITVLANDGVNPSASTQFLVNVTPAAAAPTVEQVGDQFLNAGAVLDVPYNVLDSSSNSITASVSANAVSNNDAVVSAVVTAPGVIQLTGNSGGTAIVTLTVSDGVTNPVDMAFNITVNSPPTIDPIGDQSLTSGEEITVALTLADPDPGEILTLTAISRNEGVASASAVNNNAVVLRGVSEGQTIIDLTVDDARGGVTQLSFTVNVSSAAPSFDLMAYPVLPDITPQMAQTLGLVYQGGLGLGNRANAFAKVGDDAMDSANFMAPFAAPGYNLGDFGQLQGMIDTYAATTVHGDTANSFNVDSVAAGPSFGIDTLSASAPAGPPCDAVGASTILGCELQATAPSIALISFSAANVTYMDPSQFRGELQALVTESMSTYGVIPVLATIPTGSDDQLPDYNQIIVEVATQSGVPLWNLWRAMHERGIGDPNGVAPGGAGDLTDAALGFGYNMRNLTALQALQVVRQAAGIQ